MGSRNKMMDTLLPRSYDRVDRGDLSMVTLDFETYYETGTKPYSLRNRDMTTEEYIRHKKFEVIGFSHKEPGSEAIWVTDTMSHIKQYMHDTFDWEQTALLCHNTPFDASIAAWHFGVHPAMLMDTLSMARAIHGLERGLGLAELSEYYGIGKKGTELENTANKRRTDFTEEEMARFGVYGLQDSVLTEKLFFHMQHEIPEDEIALIDVLLRMYTNPVVTLDEQRLQVHLERTLTHKKDMLKDALRSIAIRVPEVYQKIKDMSAKGKTFKQVLRSNPLFAELLTNLGVEPPMKISPRTNKETYAFAKADKDFIALAEHEDQTVSMLVAARLGNKSSIEETRTQRLLGVLKRGPLPIKLLYYGAHTGRCSGGDKMNLQNLPARGWSKGAIRKSLGTPEGYSYVVADSSQIEARMVGWLANEVELTEAFRDGKDIYSVFAGEKIYQYPVKKGMPERQVGKTAILGLGYNMGAPKYKDTLLIQTGVEVSDEESAIIVKVYRDTYVRIVGLWSNAQRAIETVLGGASAVITHEDSPIELVMEPAEGNQPARIRLPNGMYLRYPRLRRTITTEDNGRQRTQFIYSKRKGKGWEDVYTYGGKIIENIVQALARIVVFDQMVEIDHVCQRLEFKTQKLFRPVLTVHDEVVTIVPDEHADAFLALSSKLMRKVPDWAVGLPVDCEGDVGKYYGECK